MKRKQAEPAPRDYFLEQQLCRAMRDRRVVRLRYDTDLHYRTFHPYIVYREAEGRILVGGIRAHDEADIFKAPAPRRYEVGRISEFKVTDETFQIDPRFDSERPEFSNEVICSIDRVG
ncbi:MAG: WYL domain-containing protein [Gammaproteobacteria bacterium]|nr:WYL domain-containing protein [Gammaproteobacteria bacterium]